MKNSKVMKIFLVALVMGVLMLVATQTFAAEGDGFIDITNQVNSTTTNSTDTNTTNTANTTSNTVNATNPINNTTNTSNTSSYNNTNLPKTGIAQSGSMIFLIVVFVISAVYAFKKIKDYNNL